MRFSLWKPVKAIQCEDKEGTSSALRVSISETAIRIGTINTDLETLSLDIR
jgi:hypothetical protein